MRRATIAILFAAWAAGQDDALFISPDFIVEGRVVKGVPYSAQAVTSVRQTLSTGSEIVTQMTAMVARDADGRTRREQTIQTIGPWAVERPSGEMPSVILIQDPLKQLNYMLNARTHVARVTRQNIAPQMEERRGAEVDRRREEEQRRASERPLPKAEPLGTRTIEGVAAQGKRTTTTLGRGDVGNNSPIQIVVETWYSPELQVVVLGKRNDPRIGEITYKLVSIKRGDPPASLFEIPADYRIDGNVERRK